ncbi:FlgF [Buchnera aphidicola]|uniref:Flagellar basal-body rod protein n=1 Tax=Buchnera aphidicola subsp. Cinara cedri (strain Cc) TaxID=372461 RepID=Q057L9_BUCCC|nr:FlgF [Buchnera aphidicola]ABJ90680.1 flagellar basal-body rod protein [Buchnera aphidicola BCc]
MNNIINSIITLDDRNLISKETIINQDYDNIDTEFYKKYAYNIQTNSSDDQITNKKIVDINSDDNSSLQSYSNSSIDEDTETGWFSVFDDDGYEGFLREGHIAINENRELCMNNYTLLNTDEKPIIVPENKKILIKMDGTIVTKEDNNEINYKPIFLGQLKFITLNNNDVISRNESEIFDLSYSGLEKYKNNNLETKSNYVLKNTIRKNDIKKTNNLINTLNVIRSLESDMKINS